MGAKTIEDVIHFILANAPLDGEVCKKNHFTGRKFHYLLVDPAIRQLHAKGQFLDLEAFDIKGTNCMWNTDTGANYELARKATKLLLQKLQQQNSQCTLEQILPGISADNFNKTPINRYGTTLRGVLYVHDNSPYRALKDLIDHDEELKEYRDLQPYDKLMSPRETWQGIDGRKLARQATKALLNKLKKEEKGKTWEEVFSSITQLTFQQKTINRYGTKLAGMLEHVYRNSAFHAIKDLINNDEEFAEYRDIQPYDMYMAPVKTWKGVKRKKLARQATKTLLQELQEENPDKTLEEILPTITCQIFNKHPINKYGTKLSGMLSNVYGGSPYQALRDLIENDEELEGFRDFQPYDMHQSPNETWKGKQGRKLARQATKTLLAKLQQDKPNQKLAEILPEVTWETFRTKNINRYGKRLGGMISEVYGNSAYSALIDLICSDPEFVEYRDLQPYDMRFSPQGTWKGKQGRKLARQATKTLLTKLQAESPNKAMEEILPTADTKAFRKKPINKYGTMLDGMLMNVYGASPRAALLDLAEKDPEIKLHKPIIEKLRHRAA